MGIRSCTHRCVSCDCGAVDGLPQKASCSFHLCNIHAPFMGLLVRAYLEQGTVQIATSTQKDSTIANGEHCLAVEGRHLGQNAPAVPQHLPVTPSVPNNLMSYVILCQRESQPIFNRPNTKENIHSIPFRRSTFNCHTSYCFGPYGPHVYLYQVLPASPQGLLCPPWIISATTRRF